MKTSRLSYEAVALCGVLVCMVTFETSAQTTPDPVLSPDAVAPDPVLSPDAIPRDPVLSPDAVPPRPRAAAQLTWIIHEDAAE